MNSEGGANLELRLALLFLLVTELEVLAALDRALRLVMAHNAFHSQGDLLRCFCFLMEDWLCLTAEP
jgi:hypothetical protein